MGGGGSLCTRKRVAKWNFIILLANAGYRSNRYKDYNALRIKQNIDGV